MFIILFIKMIQLYIELYMIKQVLTSLFKDYQYLYGGKISFVVNITYTSN